MRYRTVIELICDASDKEDASNIAGEYLKGDVDFGVDMKCRTESMVSHRVKKYAATCAVFVLIVSALLLKVMPAGDAGKDAAVSRWGISGTYTVVPELKTQDQSEFKQEWEEKKDEAVLDYIKK